MREAVNTGSWNYMIINWSLFLLLCLIALVVLFSFIKDSWFNNSFLICFCLQLSKLNFFEENHCFVYNFIFVIYFLCGNYNDSLSIMFTKAAEISFVTHGIDMIPKLFWKWLPMKDSTLALVMSRTANLYSWKLFNLPN